MIALIPFNHILRYGRRDASALEFRIRAVVLARGVKKGLHRCAGPFSIQNNGRITPMIVAAAVA